MVPPETMCRKHLLGEHVEIHMFLGSLKKGKSVAGFLERRLLEPGSLLERHDELAGEMAKRGYVHKSLILKEEADAALERLSEKERAVKVDREASKVELGRRCGECGGKLKLDYCA